MKITEVRALQPIAANSPLDWRTTFGQILVAVDTDIGLTGYGVGGGGPPGVYIVETILRDLLLGRDPEPIEQLWQEMYQATLAFGRKGLAIMAQSGVDLALWDLAGKAARVPVARLLGGSTEPVMPTYATVWGQVPPEMVGKHRAFKLHAGEKSPGPPRDDESRERLVNGVVGMVERARQTVGADCTLMVDAWMEWDLATTWAVVHSLSRERLGWIEEPLPADDLKGYFQLADSPIPIAGGEHEFTALGFEVLIQHRLHQVLQPDVCWCGGMTELKKIYAMAKAAGLRVCPHRGAEIWGLHAIAALDPEPLAESGRPWMTWVGGQPAIVNGHIQLTDMPGFGVVIDESRLPIR